MSKLNPHAVLKQEGKVRTDLYCTECHKNFSAVIDYARNGNHRCICVWCGHEHYRVVQNGVVTEDRYNSNGGFETIDATDVRQIQTKHVVTSSPSVFIRDLWNRRED